MIPAAKLCLIAATSLLAVVMASGCLSQDQSDARSPDDAIADLLAGRFQWRAGPPLVAHPGSATDTYVSIKDPSVVYHDGRWHLFCTVRRDGAPHQIEYLSFADWESIGAADRHILTMHDDFLAAPQVFYFAPHDKWYLICQASDEAWEPKYGAAYSTTSDIADAASWTELKPLGARQADGKSGLDFWIICDDEKAHLFFTTLDGRMWREETGLSDFPTGWSEPVLAIQNDIFEASHTYRLKGLDKYLTVVEAQGGHGWRYFKAYLADRLDGEWTPIAATKDEAFASMANTQPVGERWTNCISHGELLRAGTDQRLEVDPANLRFVFQGVLDRDRAGRKYGEIPWRLGMLEQLAMPRLGRPETMKMACRPGTADPRSPRP